VALTPADRNLLAALAAEAGLVFRNLRLTAELERLSATAAELAASRRRIVTAQDEERRRLGRDLRRGPQRRLDGIAGRLGPAGDALAEDPARAAALLSELTGEANLALESLRDLARGVFPPLLGEQGLPAALRALARASGPATVTVGPVSTAGGFRPRSRRRCTSAAGRRWAPAGR
jgi:signal transduction histidine kinase